MTEPDDPLREALALYADSDNWKADDWGVRSIFLGPNSDHYGAPAALARAALAAHPAPPLDVERLRRIEAAARRYHDAEWAIRFAEGTWEGEPALSAEHNARVDEWEASDGALRVALASQDDPGRNDR